MFKIKKLYNSVYHRGTVGRFRWYLKKTLFQIYLYHCFFFNKMNCFWILLVGTVKSNLASFYRGHPVLEDANNDLHNIGGYGNNAALSRLDVNLPKSIGKVANRYLLGELKDMVDNVLSIKRHEPYQNHPSPTKAFNPFGITKWNNSESTKQRTNQKPTIRNKMRLRYFTLHHQYNSKHQFLAVMANYCY